MAQTCVPMLGDAYRYIKQKLTLKFKLYSRRSYVESRLQHYYYNLFFRLSPERVNDRPKVLVCAGPHWQGAVGICAARIMASQGIITTVYTYKEELALRAIEEQLYQLTGQMITKNIGGKYL